ncbi:MAG TPA: acetyl-CoA carboxylase, carboxyltransferase subunit beta [Ktedonobacterales bacterium]
MSEHSHAQRASVGLNGSLNGAKSAAPTAAHTGTLAVKCPKCRELLLAKDLVKHAMVCPRCTYHFRMGARERIDLLLDPESFSEFATELRTADPLGFVNRSIPYTDKIADERRKTGLDEAAVVGVGKIEQVPVVLAVLDANFIGGSMGSVVGEKVTLAVETAERERVPLVIISASGGARMYEGMYSLLQMAKTSAALARLAAAGVPFISVLTDPTTGGTTASFASLGDVILAEPGALVCFAGPRIIEQAIHVKLPPDANTSEFVLAHGMIDAVVPRTALRAALARLLRLYQGVGVRERLD